MGLVLKMRKIKTVLGDIPESNVGITLPHEHICCFSEYLYRMAGKNYLDKEKLLDCSVDYLKDLKKRYDFKTLIDCTPINIGRDVDLLKKISQKTAVNIICSTGFYHTEEPVIFNTTEEKLCEYIVSDAENVNAGIIKCAVENEDTSFFDEKLLRASSKAQLILGLPMVIHTNTNNKNGKKALDIILSEGVNPNAITIAHLSDTDDLDYIRYFAECGCYIGFDRIYEDSSDEYIRQKTNAIMALCEMGYDNKILLSHDAQFFNGFDKKPDIIKKPRLNYIFDYILPKLPKELSKKIVKDNVLMMLKCED